MSKKIFINLKAIVINLNGYQRGSSLYYGWEKNSEVYHYSWICPLDSREISGEFRAKDRKEAKEYLTDLFLKTYQDSYIPMFYK